MVEYTSAFPLVEPNAACSVTPGMARIVDCVTTMDSPWFFGKHGFVLRDAFPVPLIACRGQLGFFVPPQEALDDLAASLRAIAEEMDG